MGCPFQSVASVIRVGIMSKIFPLGLFPTKFFPDVELTKISLTATACAINVSDSDWSLQSDMTLFYGPGTMTFEYSGNAATRWGSLTDKEWTYVKTTETLPHVADFDVVSRNEAGWVLSFRPDEEGHRIEIILPEVKKIIWDGEGVDLGGEE